MLTPFGDDPEPYFSRRGLVAMRVSDDYLRCAVFIGAASGEKFLPRATGFIVSCGEEGYNFWHLVTAEHVVSGMMERKEPMYLRARFMNGDSGAMRIPSDAWFYHPDERKITDVAVTPLLTDWIREDGLKVTLNQSAVPIPEMDGSNIVETLRVGEEIAIIGLFISHYGREHNTPIVRNGNIAMLKGDPIRTRYKGFMEGYLVEARSIGGLSGSPVFVNLQGNGLGIRRNYLIGLMHGHFDIADLSADAVADMIGGGINTGVGVVVPIRDIIETLNHPDLVTLRKECAMKLNEDGGAIPDLVQEPASGAPATAGADEPNPKHREDFNRLVSAAAKKTPPSDQT